MKVTIILKKLILSPKIVADEQQFPILTRWLVSFKLKSNKTMDLLKF